MIDYIKLPRKRTRIYKKAATAVHVIASDVIIKPNLQVMARKQVYESITGCPVGEDPRQYRTVELVVFAQ